MDGTEISTLGSLAASFALVLGCSGHPAPYLSRLEDSRRLTADLRLQFGRASDATNRAVMADTDEASVAAAHEAEQAVKSVEQDNAALAPLVRGSGPAEEKRLVDDFEKCFTEYRDLDRR